MELFGVGMVRVYNRSLVYKIALDLKRNHGLKICKGNSVGKTFRAALKNEIYVYV